MPSYNVIATYPAQATTPTEAVRQFLTASLLPEELHIEVQPTDGGKATSFEGSELTEIAARNNASLARLSQQRMEFATKLSALEARITGNMTDRSLQHFGEMTDELTSDILRIIRFKLS